MLNFFKLLASLFLIIQTNMLQADELLNRTDQIKAVYLVHFVELTRWPISVLNNDRFTICLYEKNSLFPYLKELSREPVMGKQLTIEIIDNLLKNQHCQILYADKKAINQFNSNVEIINFPGLFISDGFKFVQQGGSISFQIENNKIRLLVNLQQIRNAGLDISSKLLRIARVVD